VFQELKRYLTSPPVIVAPEPGEPLLLYIAAISQAVSMVLVAKRSDPHGLHELGSSSADGSGSQDQGPAEEPGAVAVAGSQSSEAATSPPSQAVMGSLVSVLPPGEKGQELPGPAPMEMDASDPPGGPRPSNVWYTTSARSSTKPRRGTWRSTSCFMQSSSPPGSYATIFMLTGSQW
jgi:hypothetical protein